MLLPANIRSGKKTSHHSGRKCLSQLSCKGIHGINRTIFPHSVFHFRIINHVCDHCPDYHVKQSKSDKCKNIKCNVDPHIIRMNDQTQKITDRTDQTCCSREFFLSKSGCQFSGQRRTDYKHRNVAQKRNCRLCSRTSVIVRKYISCHPLHSKHCKEQKQCCHNNSNQRPVCNQILSQCRQIKFLIICRNRNTLLTSLKQST